jgi:hypothetical protein
LKNIVLEYVRMIYKSYKDIILSKSFDKVINYHVDHLNAKTPDCQFEKVKQT